MSECVNDRLPSAPFFPNAKPFLGFYFSRIYSEHNQIHFFLVLFSWNVHWQKQQKPRLICEKKVLQ